MTELSPKTYEFGTLRVLTRRANDRGTVTWLGSSDARNPSEFLNPLAETIVEEMRGATVTVDFRKLEFMNSSTVSPIINLIRKLEANSIDARVIFVDGNWQRPHLRCMKTITRAFKHVKVNGSDEAAK